MMPEALYRSPNALAPEYGRFRVADRLLLTGHSHQAWPDRSLEGQRLAWDDAAERIDGKWERAFAMADRVRAGYARLLGDRPERIALGPSTHDLLVRFLSALPIAQRRRLVTTDGEFHTIRRQLDRLEEEGVQIIRVPSSPVAGLSERLAAMIDDRTAAVLASSVLFECGSLVPGLERVAAACRRTGARFLVDAYHHLNVVPFSISDLDLEDAFVVGGGYKYCQLGEGNAFLRFPPDPALRPVVTGWFAEFDAVLEGGGPDDRVAYGPGPARFAGATYDPTSHYRAAAVFDFFHDHALHPELLREVSLHQVAVLASRFDALDPDPELITRDRATPLTSRGGFLTLRAPAAAQIVARLRASGVHADHRGPYLRLGPAPYLSDAQLEEAIVRLGAVLAELS